MVESVNLPIVVYQTEISQLFQHQYELLDRGELVAQVEKGDDEAEEAERTAKSTDETENREIRPDEEGTGGERERSEDEDDDEAEPSEPRALGVPDGPHETPEDLRRMNRDGQGGELDFIA